MPLPLSSRKTPTHNLSSISTYHVLFASSIVIVAALAVITILSAADANKGYRITAAGEGNYDITVVVDRATATEYYDYMLKYAIETYRIRDVCLPNGVLTTATASFEEISDFLMSKQDAIAIVTHWSIANNTGTLVLDDYNTIVVNIEFSYQDLLEGIATAESDPNTDEYLFRQDINLPGNRHGCCFLNLREMKDYRRRMHTQGASRIIVPFFYSLDGVHMPQILDRTL